MPPDLPAVGGYASLIRIPRRGGIVEAYRADSLGQPIWTSRAPVPPIRDVLGVNLEGRFLYLVDAARSLVAVDLEARGTRTQAANLVASAFVPNGVVYTVDTARRIRRLGTGSPAEYREPLPGATRFRLGTLGDRFVAVTDGPEPKLLVYSSERRLHASSVAPGDPVGTYWGDLVAIPSGRVVSLYETAEPFATRTIEVGDSAGPVAFSPSGHRLYAATAAGRIRVVDRYSGVAIADIELPAKVDVMRIDASGRWMLAGAAGADSVWIVDLATNRRAARAETAWAPDLPTVAGAATLVVRTGGDLVGFDLSRPGLPETGRIEGGGDDWWLVSAWLPRDLARLAASAAESVLVAQDSLLVGDSLAAVSRADQLFLQVSTSQNAEWSRELARLLSAGGHPARVLDPVAVDEGFRVVVGPYSTREEAEEVGRRLGRPYFILTNPPIRE